MFSVKDIAVKPPGLVAFVMKIIFLYYLMFCIKFSEMLRSNMQMMHYAIKYAHIYNISVTETEH